MGKLLSFVLSATALGLLVLVAVSRHGNLFYDAGLVVGFVILSALAWVAAIVTATRRMSWRRRNWGTVVKLALFFWLPVIPPLVYGLSGLRDLRARSRAVAKPSRVTRVPPVTQPVIVGPRRELVGAGDRDGVAR